MPRQLLKIVLILTGVLSHAAADVALQQKHDGPTTCWNPVPNRYGVRTLDHQRVRVEDGATTTGAEYLRLAGAAGYSGMAITPIGAAPVLEDLHIRLRLRGHPPGALLAIRVVFPRMDDANTGGPLKAIVRSDSATKATADWQELVITDAPTLVRRHARVLSGALRLQVDWRESYVDAVALVIPCGARGAEVWMDELVIEGLVNASDNPGAAAGAGVATCPIAPVEVSPGGLLVDGQPFYPRIITHTGEPLSELRRLGFNTVAFNQPPQASLLAEAAEQELWVICPPPDPAVLQSAEQSAEWSGVLAWRLPGEGDRRSFDSATARVQQIKQADQTLRRPVLAAPTDGWGGWSRLVDGLIVTAPRTPPGESASGLASRLGEAQQFALPATPLIVALDATHSQRFQTQLATFAPAGTVTPWRMPSDLLAEARYATLAGSLGIWIDKDQPLTATDDNAQRLRYSVALANLRLTLLEPWLRDGAARGEVASSLVGQTGVVFSRGRTKLITPKSLALPQADGPVRYLAPGVVEGEKAYEVSATALRPIPVTRTTGGAHVLVSTPDRCVLLTADQRAATQVQQRLSAVAQRGLALQQALAVAELRHAEAHLSPLVQTSASRSPEAAVLAQVRRLISLSKSSQASRDLDRAYQHATAAQRRLASWQRTRLREANAPGALESSPLAGQASTIIDHRRLLDLLAPLNRGPNVLPGGDFESHRDAADSGWRHIARDTGAPPAVVSFSDLTPSQGARSLRIECPQGEGAARAAVKITSPGVSLQAGQLIEITGRVRVEHSPGDGVLTISDSIGGDELALRVTRAAGWQPFRLLRRPDQAGVATIGFSAQGPITVGLDAVMLRTIELPSAAKAAVLGAPALQRK